MATLGTQHDLLPAFPVYYGPGGSYYVPADYGVPGGSVAAVLPQAAHVMCSAPVYPVTAAPVGSINATCVQPFPATGTAYVPSSTSPVEGAKQRCTKCTTYFTVEENVEGACVFHPGQYSTPECAGPVMMPSSTLRRWSCCKSLEREAPGCRWQRHTADPATAAILCQFAPTAQLRDGLVPTADGGLAQVTMSSNYQKESDNKEALFLKEEEKEEEDILRGLKRMQVSSNPRVDDASITGGGPVMVRHLVAKTDTLAGISLRYGVKVDDIMRANNLSSQSIFAYKHLVVPNPARQPTPEELNSVMPKDGKRSIAMERFSTLAKCSREEAQFYLEDNNFDIKEALAAYQADLEWEKNAPKPHKVTTKKRF